MREQVLEEAIKRGYDMVTAFEPENVFYLTGFWGEGIAIHDANNTILIVPKLEAERARKSSKSMIIESERGIDMLNILKNNVYGKVCTDCNDILTFNKVKESVDLIYDSSIFYNARVLKSDDEIRNIKRASQLLDKLFSIAEKEIRIGMSELEIQALLMYEALKLNLKPASYKFTSDPLIIASGINSSLPHAQPSNRKIRRGDLITIDLTLRYNGYIADSTRTFAIDSITKEKKEIYNIVKEAQEEGTKMVKDGIEASMIDKACRDIIRKYGYDKYFIHSTGHGIGLEVHELPWIRSNSNDIIKEKMAITIEPGIYLAKYGIRIEDSILVKRGNCEVLNKYPKELIII
jgi:Xaa-Pro aminopeptidase/Xaa-Pro dipeptidase